MSFLEEADAERRYTWWKAGKCPNCGCGFYFKEHGTVIAEGVKVCGCCAGFQSRMSDADIPRILAQLAEGARLFGGSG